MPLEIEQNRRVAKRETVMRGAKMVFGNSIIDCVVQNISTHGAKVRTASVVPIPDRINLHLRDGPSYAALRVWTRGEQIGFQFMERSLSTEACRLAAGSIHRTLRTQSLDETMQRLRAADFFGDSELSELGAQAEAGLARLEMALRAMMTRTTERH